MECGAVTTVLEGTPALQSFKMWYLPYIQSRQWERVPAHPLFCMRPVYLMEYSTNCTVHEVLEHVISSRNP